MEVKKMSIKEKLVAKQEELKALMPQVNEGNEEAIKSSEGLVEEIKGLEELIRKADEATAIMQNIGQVKEEKTDEVKAANLEELKTVKGSRSFAYKAYNDVQTKPTVNVVDNKVVDPQGALNVRSLFGSESINGIPSPTMCWATWKARSGPPQRVPRRIRFTLAIRLSQSLLPRSRHSSKRPMSSCLMPHSLRAQSAIVVCMSSRRLSRTILSPRLQAQAACR
jgi:hypothetical protein